MPVFTEKYVALDGIQNPDNLGAISRTAEALGVDALIVGGGCDIYNPKALRASMGRAFETSRHKRAVCFTGAAKGEGKRLTRVVNGAGFRGRGYNDCRFFARSGNRYRERGKRRVK